MKKICIIGAGHAFKFQYEALKKLGYDILVCDIDLDKLKDYDNTIADYKDIPEDYELVLISTPPATHYEIIKYLSSKGKRIICEKPLVTTLGELYNLLDSDYGFYNVLHFAYGDEIEFFKNSDYLNKELKHVKVYINDPYIENGHIKKEQLGLNGSYLDETINPISALRRLFNKEILHKKTVKFKYDGDIYDYASISSFDMGDVIIDTFVKWNDEGNRNKYIDLYYENEVIRLDSINKSVINLTSNEVLYKNDEERMYKHYLNAFKDFEKNNDNKKESLELNYQILRGV